MIKINLTDVWYLVSWASLVLACLTAFVYWPLMLSFGYIFVAGLTLSWVHGYWWDNHGSASTEQAVE